MSRNPEVADLTQMIAQTQSNGSQNVNETILHRQMLQQQQANEKSKNLPEVPPALLCPVIATAMSGSLDKFKRIIQSYKNQKKLPSWSGVEIISSLPDLKVPRVLLLVDAESKSTLFHYASMNSVQHVEYLLSLGLQPILNFRNINGNAPIVTAISSGKLDIVEAMLKAGATLDISNAVGGMPIHAAIMSKNSKMFEFVLKHSGSIDKFDKTGSSPLHLAITVAKDAESDLEKAKEERDMLIAHHDDAASAKTLLDVNKGTPAEKKEKKAALKKLSDSLSRVNNAINDIDNTISTFESRVQGAVDICLKIVDLVNVSAVAEGSKTISHFHYAIRAGFYDLVRAMVEKDKTLVNQVNPEDNVLPIHSACMQSKLEIVKYLVENGADIKSIVKVPKVPLPAALANLVSSSQDEDFYYYSCIYYAVTCNATEIVEYLLQDKNTLTHHVNSTLSTTSVDFALPGLLPQSDNSLPQQPVPQTVAELVNILKPFVTDGENKQTPLSILISMFGYTEQVKTLIENGININTINVDIEFSLVERPTEDEDDISKILIINVNETNFTALITAIKSSHEELVKFLLGAGADTNLTFPYYMSKFGIDVTELLILPLSVDQNDKVAIRFNFSDIFGGTTPLTYSIKSKNSRFIHSLVAHKADINQRAVDGSTCFHSAASSNDPALMTYLLSNGGNPAIADMNGFTPLSYAVQQDNYENVAVMMDFLDASSLDVAAANMQSVVFSALLSEKLPYDFKKRIRQFYKTIPSTKDNIHCLNGSVVRSARFAGALGSVLSLKVLLRKMRAQWVKITHLPPATVERTGDANVDYVNDFDGRVKTVSTANGDVTTILDQQQLAVVCVSKEEATSEIEKMNKDGGEKNNTVYMLLSTYIATELLSICSQQGFLAIVTLLFEFDGMPLLSGLQGDLYIDTFHHFYYTTPEGPIKCRRADPIQIDNYTASPLHAAIANNHQNLVKGLVDVATNKGVPELADITKLSDDDLFKLSPFSHPSSIISLIRRKCRDGYNALHFAAQKDQPVIAILMFNLGLDINEVSDSGDTAIHIAITHQAQNTMNILAKCGADLNIVNKAGFTAMHSAAYVGGGPLVHLLATKYKGDLTIKTTSDGMDVNDIVKDTNRLEQMMATTGRESKVQKTAGKGKR